MEGLLATHAIPVTTVDLHPGISVVTTIERRAVNATVIETGTGTGIIGAMSLITDSTTDVMTTDSDPPTTDVLLLNSDTMSLATILEVMTLFVVGIPNHQWNRLPRLLRATRILARLTFDRHVLWLKNVHLTLAMDVPPLRTAQLTLEVPVRLDQNDLSITVVLGRCLRRDRQISVDHVLHSMIDRLLLRLMTTVLAGRPLLMTADPILLPLQTDILGPTTLLVLRSQVLVNLLLMIVDL